MSRIPKRFSTLTYKGLALIILICFGLFFVVDRLVTTLEDRKFVEGYDEIEAGMQETMVLSILGAATDRLKVDDLDQQEEAVATTEPQEQSEPVYYLNWRKESGAVYTIGFDREGKVVTMEPGAK